MHVNGVKEQLAYLKGLSSGLNIETTSAEGRVLAHIVLVLDALTETMEKLSEDSSHLEEYVSALDEDLTDLEEDFYDEYNDDTETGQIGDGPDYLAIDCPVCRETVYVNEEMFNDEGGTAEIVCPKCNETIYMDDGQVRENHSSAHYTEYINE